MDVFLGIMAVYRVSRMFVREEGPFGVFQLMREKVDPEQKTWVGRGINCIYCVSFWVALLVAVLPEPIQRFTLHWLGLAGGVLILRQLIVYFRIDP